MADRLLLLRTTEYVEDDYAIVQSPDFATLFILSRTQNVTDDKITVRFQQGDLEGMQMLTDYLLVYRTSPTALSLLDRSRR